MENKQRSLLFKLVMCQGIGNLGRLKYLQYALKTNTIKFCVEEIIKIAEITTYKKIFLDSWYYWSKHEKILKFYEQNCSFFTILDSIYPQLLKEIYKPPALLFYKGDLQLLHRKKLAMVGARQMTIYGKQVIEQFVPSLINEGFTIVSGLAKGVDSYVHQMAINCQGKTIAVIGNGLDYFYPKDSEWLQKKLEKDQLILSEYPADSGPKKFHFPARNRIIAGLTLGTCVIEAKKQSGSLITAQAAMEYGREVFAIPDSIFHSNSIGCHALIQDGAKCTVSVQDILEELVIY